jgi:hypothetical protein
MGGGTAIDSSVRTSEIHAVIAGSAISGSAHPSNQRSLQRPQTNRFQLTRIFLGSGVVA